MCQTIILCISYCQFSKSRWLFKLKNPSSPESFSQQYTFVCIQHVPHLQVLLPASFAPLRPELVREVHMKNPSGNTINHIHDHPGAKQFVVKVEIRLILNLDWILSAKCPCETIGVVYESH